MKIQITLGNNIFGHLMTCLTENNVFNMGEAAVFIILLLSHSILIRDHQNLMLGAKNWELVADMLYSVTFELLLMLSPFVPPSHPHFHSS
jgi:hypothetical protein